MNINFCLQPDGDEDGCKYSSGVSSPVLFLAWMIVGVVWLLPVLDPHRQVLVPMALIPALAALWSRRTWGGVVGNWPMVAGLVWGLGMVLNHAPITLNLPAAIERQKIVVEGVVADREDSHNMVRLTLAESTSGQWRASGLIRIGLYRQSTTVLPGDRVRIPVRIHASSGFRNPGGFDYQAYLLENNIIATGSAMGPVEKIGTTNGWFWNRWRQKIADWISVTLPEQRGLGEALLVGKRGYLDNKLQEALFVSGTYHLVAISGLHLSLVGGLVYYLLRLLLSLILPLSRRWDMKRPAAFLSLFPVLAYAYLAGWSVSTQRAFIMVGLFLLAVSLQRQRQSWRILALAAIIILSWHPQQLMNAGFQLSFLCVAVILFFLDHLPAKGWRQKLIWTVVTTVALALVTAPVSMYTFHRFAPYGIVINLLAIPWVGELSTQLGLAAMVTHLFWSAGGDFLLNCMGWTLEVYRWVIEQTVDLPGAWSRGPGPSLPGMALYLAAGFVAVSIRWPGRWWWRRVVFGLIAVVGLGWPRETIPDKQLRLIVLDVGQALSMLLKMPEGGWSVVDAGGMISPRFNVGEQVISSVLWHYGVQRLERVVISHPQIDHMAGAAQLLKNFPVGSLWVARFSPSELQQPAMVDLLATAEKHQVPIRYFDTLEEIREGGGVLRMLPPELQSSGAKGNDRSLAMEIAYGDHRFLLTGDMETREESWLLSKQVLSPVTVLLAPHHGSLTSSSEPFVQATHPKHVVFSVGVANQWGFPKPEVMQRWSLVGARLWRTDQDGAISFHSDGTHLEITTGQ